MQTRKNVFIIKIVHKKLILLSFCCIFLEPWCQSTPIFRFLFLLRVLLEAKSVDKSKGIIRYTQIAKKYLYIS